MPTIKIQISDEAFRTLKSVFQEDITTDFASAAFQEWAAWLDGSRRIMSTTELETERIYIIYNQILKNSIPSAGSIGQIFNLPLGRSQYIVRNLKYKYPKFFRSRKIILISRALENGNWTTDKSTCVIEISAECQDLLDRTIKGLVANGKLNSEVRGSMVFDNIRYELGGRHHAVLLDEFTKMQNS